MYKLSNKQEVQLDINGEKVNVMIKPSDILLDVLRDQLGLSGSKPSCKNGDCGACTIHVDGWPLSHV